MNSRDESNPDALANRPIQLAQHLVLDRAVRGNLVNQIVEQVGRLASTGALTPLDRMPSVRGLAQALGVSSFSIVEAYDRLVASGHLTSRRGSGYFVAPARMTSVCQQSQPAKDQRPTLSTLLEPELFGAGTVGATVPVGGPWLPSEWLDAKWLQECCRAALRSQASLQQGFTHVLGLVDLRRQTSRRLQQMGIEVEPDHVLLARGAAHGIDLILRALTRPGDPVLVEDPSYPGMLPLLEQHGCEPLLIPRSADGLDLELLEKLASTRKPSLAIVTTALHNPLGVTLSAMQAHQLLALAERFDFRIVEDDVFRELAEPRAPSLAAMDGLRRVIRVDGTSKFLPAMARVGSVVAAPAIIDSLARVKMVTGLTSSEFSEKLALHALSSSDFRRHISRIKARLDAARESTLEVLEVLDFEVLATPQGGPFVSARLKESTWTGTEVAQFALDRGIVLSPSLRFCRSQGDAPWFRFNVAYTQSHELSLREVFAELRSAHPAGLAKPSAFTRGN